MPARDSEVLIIRGWIEEGSAEPLRASIRLSRDRAGGVTRSVTLTRSDDVRAFVAGWLDEILGRPTT